jgi:alkylated DNA repair dioxygenase AlkB
MLDEESALIESIQQLPLQEARYKDYTAKRRIVSYGSEEPLPGFLLPLQTKVGAWLRVPASKLEHVLVAEYRPATALGLSLELAPRSAYVLRDAARWRWQHSIPATTVLRYSITFRTLA